MTFYSDLIKLPHRVKDEAEYTLILEAKEQYLEITLIG
jgi:hypothetical protein